MISKLTCPDSGIKARWARGPNGGLCLVTSLVYDLVSDFPAREWRWSGPEFGIPGPGDTSEIKDGTSEMDEDAYIAAVVKANSHLYEENQRPFSYEDE